jgi:hypothetical protein
VIETEGLKGAKNKKGLSVETDRPLTIACHMKNFTEYCVAFLKPIDCSNFDLCDSLAFF